jgi:Pyruvate/2-oxoacid:ferredoxin oxidoreductase delta subunit
MTKTIRKIITIDEEKCDGCGNCVPACVEGALQIIDGKARLVKESYCDGLGACLGDCPQDALHVTEMEVEAYDEPGVLTYLGEKSPELVERHVEHLKAHGMTSSYEAPKPARAPVAMCPSVRMDAWEQPTLGDQGAPIGVGGAGEARAKSELRQWPVQLTLLPPNAPFLQDAQLTLIADCVPFANPNMHADFLRDGAIAVACPKLDDGQAYINKLAQMIQAANIRSIRVAYMEVPCCRGLVFIAQQAILLSGKDVPLTTELVKIHA